MRLPAGLFRLCSNRTCWPERRTNETSARRPLLFGTAITVQAVTVNTADGCFPDPRSRRLLLYTGRRRFRFVFGGHDNRRTSSWAGQSWLGGKKWYFTYGPFPKVSANRTRRRTGGDDISVVFDRSNFAIRPVAHNSTETALLGTPKRARTESSRPRTFPNRAAFSAAAFSSEKSIRTFRIKGFNTPSPSSRRNTVRTYVTYTTPTRRECTVCVYIHTRTHSYTRSECA